MKTTFNLLLLFFTLWSNCTIAQEDVTHYIVNAGFDNDLTFNADGSTKMIVDKSASLSARSWGYVAEDNSIYAWAKTSDEGNANWNGADGRSHALNGYIGQIEGWTVSNADKSKCEWAFFGSLPYALQQKAIPLTDNGNTYQVMPSKPINDNSNDNVGALFLRAGWGASCSYKQVVSIPCAKYRLEYWTININTNASSNATDLSNITCRGEVFKDENGTGLSAMEWTKHEFEFMPTSEFTIEFGYKSNANSGSNNNPHVFIDGIKLYKIGETNYEQILREELQSEVDKIYALADDECLANFKSIAEEIYGVGESALQVTDISEMEVKIEEIKLYYQKISDLLPIIESLKSLLSQAESIKNTSSPYGGYEVFIKKYDEIVILIKNATTDNITTYTDRLSAAINEYYQSGGEYGAEGIDCSFLIINPHFTKKDAEPTYIDSGIPVYPNIANYSAGAVPVDGTSEGWYTSGVTSGDQRLNFAQGRICWNLWDTNPGHHSINQDLTNLPEGFYSVSADMITQSGREHEAHVYAKTSSDDVSSPFLTAGYWSNTNDGEWTTLKTDRIRVSDGNLTIGGRSIFPEYSQNGWFCMTNVHLYFHGEEVEMEKIIFSNDELKVYAGEKRKLEVSVMPENTTFKNLKFVSDNPDIVDVDKEGNLIALSQGVSVITAYSCRNNDIYARCNVKVEINYEGINSLIINEIQSANIDMFVDPSFNYGGWVELYNPTDKPVSLYGLYVSDDPNNLKKFKLNIDAGAVPAKGFKNIWFDHNEDRSSQVDFKLSYDGETIYLSDQDGELITSQDFPNVVARTSYARITDGGLSWGLTAEPTPERSNSTSAFAIGRLDAPIVDKDARLFDSPFTVSVNIPSGAILRYTTNGTTPTLTNGQTSKTGIFNVSNTTTYRFRLFQDGKLPSEVITRSYLYRDRDIVFPVISVVTDPINLYSDSLGIFVKGVNGKPGNGQDVPCNWNMDWDRPVNFEYITSDNGMVINQEVDMSMCGGWSRAWTPHSFKLKANKMYEGRNFYEYSFFDAKPYLKHKTLQIRNGGNDNGSRIKDAALQQIIQTSGIDIDGQAYMPIVHFINGEYKGLLNMREPNNKHFVYANYGYDSEEIDMFEMNPTEGYVQMTGTEDSFLDWYNMSFNASDQQIYEKICDIVDIDEYVNYMAVGLYLGNTDWIRNNVKGFKPRYEGGKYRFVLFDLDHSFGTSSPFYNLEGLKKYDFNGVVKEIKLTTIFFNMLENSTFRKKFVDVFCIVTGSVFTPERSKMIINSIAENVFSTLQQEGQNPYNTANDLINSLNDRQQVMIDALKNYNKFDLTNLPEQKIAISGNNNEVRISINNLNIPTNKFDGSLFAPIVLRSSAPATYKFTGWKCETNIISSETELFSKGTLWNYYDQGALDGNDWTTNGFPGNWDEGNAPLGYYTGGDRGYKTILDYGADANNKRPTYYFRKIFNLTELPTENDMFVLDYIVDDGFIVYINGIEAGRYLMSSGNVSFNTYASSHASNNPDTGSMMIDASLFKKGENVIAIEVHNNSASSTDIYFDASLSFQSYVSKDYIVSEDELYEIPAAGNYNLTACYEPLSEKELKEGYVTPVKINEICASNSIYINEYYEKNDWIELYNTTGKDYDIAGMYISDNINKSLKYQIPTDGIVNTIIKPYSHIILWADKLTPISQLHTSFKLGSEGGEVILTSADQTWCDTLVYAPHNGDYSVGLYPDGGTEVYIMNKTTLASTNIINSYSQLWDEPIIPNSISDVEISRNGGLSLAYNGENIDIRCENSGNVSISVYTVSGQICMKQTFAITGNAECVNIASLPTGTYIVRAADAKDNRCVIKVHKK